MELVYIWIKNYKNLKDIKLNISNQWRISYSSETGLLTKTETKNYVPGFFAENINAITGIIGENGTGKTNSFRFMLASLVEGIVSQEIPEAIFVYGNGTQLFVSFPPSVNVQFAAGDFIIATSVVSFSKSVTFLFHSNHFDPLITNEFEDLTRNEFAGQHNISTGFLLWNDIENFLNVDRNDPSIRMQQAINIHKNMELNRQVRLIRKFYNKRLLINLPRYLVVSVNTNDEQQYNIKGISISGKFDKLYNDVSKKRNRQELLLLNIFRSLVFNFLNNWNFSINYRPEELIDDFLTKLDVFIFGSVNFFLSSVNNFIGSLIADDMPDAIKGPLARISDILSATEPFLSSRSVSHDSQAFFINIVNENVGSVFAYTEKYFATESITNPLNFRLSHNQFQDTSFSSGEYALLSFFARLNWIKKKDLRENIILLIDEAELALHPYWQTQFLQTVITFLQDEFAHRKIQIIITSHSPFIVSDLPPHCIIFLEKQNGETITVDHLERHKETFGANIHQLFTEGFFLKDSLMGEFARIKIDALIKEVNAKKTFTQAEFEKLMPLIEIVGEPFIRAKLLEKMANGMLPEAIDILIRQREDELNLLKQKRNDKN